MQKLEYIDRFDSGFNSLTLKGMLSMKILPHMKGEQHWEVVEQNASSLRHCLASSAGTIAARVFPAMVMIARTMNDLRCILRAVEAVM